ncbi:ATP-binding protein [Streptomyces sp. NPDC102274]|uniref:ATP-binding protein n=1 Tax=Streptomyces sp. NPDC102274 TaxID=3366151 RepID=UPI00381F9B5A
MPESETTPVSTTSDPTPGGPDVGAPGSVTPNAPGVFGACGGFGPNPVDPPLASCPPPLPGLEEPSPRNLAYSLTLPAGLASPTVAREVAELVLDVHEMERLIDPALVVVRELVAYASRFSGDGADVYLFLRQRADTLRVTVRDTHAAHPHPHLAALCAERRRSALERTPDVVAAYRGTWGFRSAQCPGAGTWTWATLVHTPRSWAA